MLESLVAAGAFDAIEPNRARVFAAADAILATAQRTHEDAARGQSELFGGAAAPEPIVLPAVEPWLPAERLQREYDAIGFFLSAAIRSTIMPPRSSGCACSPGRSSRAR